MQHTSIDFCWCRLTQIFRESWFIATLPTRSGTNQMPISSGVVCENDSSILGKSLSTKKKHYTHTHIYIILYMYLYIYSIMFDLFVFFLEGSSRKFAFDQGYQDDWWSLKFRKLNAKVWSSNSCIKHLQRNCSNWIRTSGSLLFQHQQCFLVVLTLPCRGVYINVFNAVSVKMLTYCRCIHLLDDSDMYLVRYGGR